MHPRLHLPQLASIDKKKFSAAVAAMRHLVAGQEPETGGNLGIQEELRRRISPSLFWLEIMEPLASATPAWPVGFFTQIAPG